MKTFNQYNFRSIFGLLIFISTSFTHQQTNQNPNALSELHITFTAVSNQSPLIIGKTYSNSFHESFTVDRFRFYVGEIRLRPGSGMTEAKPGKDNYYLFDLADSSSSEIILPLNAGTYEGIDFLLGVDSIHSASGAQTGALDPRKGMYWTWNSGYVMLKLEGNSSLSNLPGHTIEYHLGGYRAPNNVSQQVSLSFQKGKELKIGPGEKNQLNISVDINKLFDGPTPVHMSDMPACNTPGPLAKSISDNCKQMFSLQE
ncbi:MAG TPA: MbnP family protein [Puia sp.]|nr:MbnP family protein [Puia sp.]